MVGVVGSNPIVSTISSLDDVLGDVFRVMVSILLPFLILI